MDPPASPTLSPTSPYDRTVLGSDTEVSKGPPTCVPSDEQVEVMDDDGSEVESKKSPENNA